MPAFLRTLILRLCYCLLLASYPGERCRYDSMKQEFYWRNMANDFCVEVKGCWSYTKNRWVYNRPQKLRQFSSPTVWSTALPTFWTSHRKEGRKSVYRGANGYICQTSRGDTNKDNQYNYFSPNIRQQLGGDFDSSTNGAHQQWPQITLECYQEISAELELESLNNYKISHSSDQFSGTKGRFPDKGTALQNTTAVAILN